MIQEEASPLGGERLDGGFASEEGVTESSAISMEGIPNHVLLDQRAIGVDPWLEVGPIEVVLRDRPKRLDVFRTPGIHRQDPGDHRTGVGLVGEGEGGLGHAATLPAGTTTARSASAGALISISTTISSTHSPIP